MRTLEINEAIVGKAVAWSGVVVAEATGDAEFVIRFTDGTSCRVSAWQQEGRPTEMSFETTTPI